MPSLKLSVEAQIEKPSSINFVAQPINPLRKASSLTTPQASNMCGLTFSLA
jgi:hypothetical protein